MDIENNNFSVYCHTNKINNKKYIGITSKKPEVRWNNGLGYKKQYFWQAIQKYGWDNFEHEILYNNLTQEEAQNKEKDLIKLYQTNNNKYGYNRSDGGEFDADSVKIKLNQYDLNGIFIKTWDSLAELSEHLNLDPSTISKNITLGYQTKGYIIKKYNGNINNIKPYSRKLTTTKINQYDINGFFIKTWNSMKEITEEFGCNRSQINSCCKKKQRLFRNKYYFRYYSGNQDNLIIENYIHPNSKKVGQFDNDNNLINIYTSVQEAIKVFKNTGIYNCLQGKSKTCGGYIWKYI